MGRRTLTDEQWERIAAYLPGREGTCGRSGVDNRLFEDAILWMAGNAARWRDLPEVFGKWTGGMPGSDAGRVPVYGNDFSIAWLIGRTSSAPSSTAPFRKSMPMRQAQKGAETAAIGRSRGGLTTKLHAVVDAIDLPIRIHPTPGQWGDRPQAETLLAGLNGVGHVIVDAAYDADHLRTFIADDLGATAQIKSNPSRTAKPPIYWRLYKERHQVKCFFNKLKRFRRIALRCEKTISAFLGFVHLACAMIWLR
ncbi:IS5 family transposase [Sphingomonas yabuuchiae]